MLPLLHTGRWAIQFLISRFVVSCSNALCVFFTFLPGPLKAMGLPWGFEKISFLFQNTLSQEELNMVGLSSPEDNSVFFANGNASPPAALAFWQWVLLVWAGAVLLSIWMHYRLAQKQLGAHLRSSRVQDLHATVFLEKHQRLQQLHITKNQLFSGLSHEMRRPLHLIQQLSSEIQSHEQISSFAQILQQQVGHLNGMLDELIHLSKMLTSPPYLVEKKVVFPDFLQNAIHQLSPLAEKKALYFTTEWHANGPSTIVIDLEKAERIVGNLLHNAFKFTPERGSVHLKAELSEQFLSIAIRDTGPGIPADEQARIFDFFQQGKTAVEGYGVGLGLSKKYVEWLGGSIALHSENGKGSCFTLQLPIDRSKATTEETPTPEATPLLKQPLGEEQLSVLIVEDHEAEAQILCENLSVAYHTLWASNGAEAWTILQAQTSIALVISDVLMPEKDGFDLLTSVRQDDRLRNMPFIMLTALYEEEDRLKALRLGATVFITKPFNLQELLLQVKNLLQQQPSPSKAVPNHNAAEEQTSLSYDEQWIRTLESVVDQNLSRSDYKRADLAFDMHVSERTLYNKIDQYLGISPAEYLRNARLAKAKEYLESRKYATLKEVMYAVGMRDRKNFNKLFKKAYGMSPNEYQEEHYRL